VRRGCKDFKHRAYSSKSTASWKPSSKLRASFTTHAEQEEYEKNKRTMNKTEVSTTRLGPEKAKPRVPNTTFAGCTTGCREVLPSSKRFFEGLANKPKIKKPHKYFSLVYPLSGWKLSNIREVRHGKNKKKKARLHLSKR